jgi:hypothetical protein
LLGGAEIEAIAEIAPHAMLIADAPTSAATAAARERLAASGFEAVTVLLAARAGAAAGTAAAA